MKILSLIPILFLISACSVYKSQGRKQFESDAPGKIKTYSLLFCQKQNTLFAWFQAEFPSKNYELVVAETDLEIWKSKNKDGGIDVRAVQINNSGQIVCNYAFANENVWQAFQTQFIHELENNLMTAD